MKTTARANLTMLMAAVRAAETGKAQTVTFRAVRTTQTRVMVERNGP